MNCVAELLSNTTLLYGTRIVVALSTIFFYCTRYRVIWINSTSSHLIYLKSIFILSSQIRVRIPGDIWLQHSGMWHHAVPDIHTRLWRKLMLPPLASALKLLAAGSSEKLCYYITWSDIPTDDNPSHSCEKPPVHSFQLSPLNIFVAFLFPPPPPIYYMPLQISEYICCYVSMVNRLLPSIYSPSHSLQHV
jgi:hypothetical protein